MKFTKEMQDRIIKWVELNGLYPQPCGATLQSLCNACGINDVTFWRWQKNETFAASLSRAREKFAATVEVDLVNALIRSAKGMDYTKEKQEATAQVIEEFDPKTGKRTKRYTTEKLVPKRATHETVYYSPNVDAAKFVLTNIAPERWKLKQEHTIGADSQPLVLSLTQRGIDGLSKALESGAAPRAPKDEETDE